MTWLLSAAGEMPAGTILQFDKALLLNIIVQAVNILVLTAVLVFLLYKPVQRFMEARVRRIQSEVESAAKEREEALALKGQYEKLIAGIETEREELLHQAHKKAMEKSDQMIFNARREAEAIHARALAELEMEKKNREDEMKRQMIEISVMMAGKLVQVNMNQALHDQYIDEALAHWEES